VRALALICIVLALVQPLALPQVADSPSFQAILLPRVLHEPGVVAPALLRRAFEPPLFPMISAVALASLGIVAGELSVALIAAILARHAARRSTRSTICLRVRPAHTTAGTNASVARPGALMRMVHGGMAKRFWMHPAPPYTLLISGAPDLPAELGALISGTPDDQQRAMGVLDGAVRSSAPGAQIDATDDPLIAAATPDAGSPGSASVWRCRQPIRSIHRRSLLNMNWQGYCWRQSDPTAAWYTPGWRSPCARRVV